MSDNQASGAEIHVEVVYALPERQYLHKVVLAAGSTLEQAIQASGILSQRHDIDLAKNKVGVFSRPARLNDLVNDGDRVEIYRPLLIDPKDLRRQRAERTKK
ncbi:RnfH family protein [Sodalis sp. RH21]|uniref:RnfH family protein n=1 Tax=unclassified Sodalis (in: enterobacteria) TaxID=2636512 RepID=UPI0039B4592C